MAEEEKLKRENNESTHLVALGKSNNQKRVEKARKPNSTVIRKARISIRVRVRSRRMEMKMPRTQTLSVITATKRVTRGLIVLSLRLS